MQVGEIQGYVLLFVIVGITAVVGTLIIANLSADFAADTAEANISANVQESTDVLIEWMPTIALVIAASVILSIVIGSFAGRQ